MCKGALTVCPRTCPGSYPLALIPACAHTHSRSYLLTLIRTIPGVCLYTLGFVHDPCACLMLVHSPRSFITPAPCTCSSIPGSVLGFICNPLCSPRTLLLPLPLPLRVCPHWLPGSCASTLCLSFSLWYLTCNRIVSLSVLYLPFYLDSTYL